MDPWIVRLIMVILAVAFVPIVVNGTATLTVKAINSVGHGVHSLLEPLSMSGDAKLEGVIKLCLYLVAITVIVRFFLGRNR